VTELLAFLVPMSLVIVGAIVFAVRETARSQAAVDAAEADR
jgi:hypothetical protein